MRGMQVADPTAAVVDDLPIAGQFAAIHSLLDSTLQDDSVTATPQRDVSAARILIVDDEPINVKVVCRYLREAGYKNCSATNDSRTAVDLIQCEKPDLVLLDLMMPQVDGLQILRLMRQDRLLQQTPVVVLTATDDRSTKQAALELGANEFLTKPVDPTDLLPRIRNVLTVKAYQDHLTNYARELERKVQERTAELRSVAIGGHLLPGPRSGIPRQRNG